MSATVAACATRWLISEIEDDSWPAAEATVCTLLEACWQAEATKLARVGRLVRGFRHALGCLLHRARLVEDVADDGLNARLELAGEIGHRLALLAVGPLLRLLLLGMHPPDGRRIVLEHGQRLGEPADLVVAVGIGHLERAVAGGKPLGQRGDFCQWPGHAAADHAGRTEDQDQHGQTDIAERRRGLAEDGVDIVEIDAGADDPAPGRKALHIGDFPDRLVEAGLRPEVAVEARALLLDDVDEAHEQRVAGGILHPGQILAVELRLDRMHDHLRGHVVDPEILDLVVAQALDLGDRGGLGLLAREFPVALELLVVGEDAVADIDHLLRLGLTIGDHLRAQGRQRDRRQRDHAEKADADNQDQLETDAGENHRSSRNLAGQTCQFIPILLAKL
ncbi:hypothetical protein ABIF83_007877 [Bradyrhizobium ottawaense]